MLNLQVMHEGQQIGVINVDDAVAKGKLSKRTQKQETFTGKSGGIHYDTATLHVAIPGGKVQIGRASRPATITVWKV